MNDIARTLVLNHEGYKNELYKDTEGKWTIGVGYNIEEYGLPDWVIFQLFESHLLGAELECTRMFPSFHMHNKARQAVLIDMMYNLGYTRLGTFKRFRMAMMIAHVDDSKYQDAADEMLDSRWARQVGNRAKKLAKIMREGKL